MNKQTQRARSWPGKLFVGLQYFLPQHALTQLVRWFMARESIWLKDMQIKSLSKFFSINTEEAEKPVPEGYASFNEFFTRKLKPSAREIVKDDSAVISPCDGMVSECGRIIDGQLIQAKGFRYSSADLLQDAGMAASFANGHFMTIYLAPYDYHRVHFPVRGHVQRERHIPGQLFSVNGATAAAVPRLFARNERREFIIANDEETIALVMVGALNVGSISTTWEDLPLVAGSLDGIMLLEPPVEHFEQGDTIGWFNMGSTVILLLPESNGGWQHSLTAGSKVRLGQRLTA